MRFFAFLDKRGNMTVSELLLHFGKLAIAVLVLFMLLSYVNFIEEDTEFEAFFLSRDLAMFENAALSLPGDMEYKYSFENLDMTIFNFYFQDSQEYSPRPSVKAETKGASKFYPYGKDTRKKDSIIIRQPDYLIFLKNGPDLDVKKNSELVIK